MRTDKQFIKHIALTVFLVTGIATAGMSQELTTIVNPDANTPAILSTSPSDGEMNVDLNSAIEITFSTDMDETTLNGTTLLLQATYADTSNEMPGEMQDNQIRDRATMEMSDKKKQYTTGSVSGTISYSNKVALFTPNSEMTEGTVYTFTVTNGVENSENIALENDYTWSFTTTGTSGSAFSNLQNENYSMESTEYGEGEGSMDTLFTSDSMESGLNGEEKMIDLGKAGQFVILAKTSINNESASRITGQTGEGSETDSLQTNTTSDAYSVRQTQNSMRQTQNTLVRNAMVQVNQNDIKPSPDVTEALEDMMTAFNNASMQNGVDSTSQLNEDFKASELSSGIHEWSDSLHITSDVTLSGSSDDVWLFKVGENLIVDENTIFTLTNGARAENIFWVVEGDVTIGENAKFEGIILSMNEITLESGAEMNGRMFSQTSITLNDNIITEPVQMAGQTTSTNR